MLDKISFQIMLELCQDGRISNASLAQKLGKSEHTIAKRINAMIADDVIAIKALPNPAKMGYQASAFIGLKVDLKKIDKVCAQLMDDIHINLVVTCFGRFDVLVIVYFREWAMLQNFIKNELPGIDGINHIETYLVSEAKKRNKGVFSNTGGNVEPVVLDETNQHLIQELIKNGRPSYTDLADKLGISVSTISRRISTLIKNDMIEILAIPNPSKLGYLASAFIMLRIELAKAAQIIEHLSSYPEVHTVMRLMNDYDILFGVDAADAEALYDFIKSKIANIEGILSTETFVSGHFLYFSGEALIMPSLNAQSINFPHSSIINHEKK